MLYNVLYPTHILYVENISIVTRIVQVPLRKITHILQLLADRTKTQPPRTSRATGRASDVFSSSFQHAFHCPCRPTVCALVVIPGTMERRHQCLGHDLAWK